MKQYIAYHNPEKRNKRATEIDVSNGYYCLTNKKFTQSRSNDLIGGRVWLITGELKMGIKTYYAAYTFITDEIVSGFDGFSNKISGQDGQSFNPLKLIDTFNWFPKMKKRAGNFGLGFSEIKDIEIIDGLNSLIK